MGRRDSEVTKDDQARSVEAILAGEAWCELGGHWAPGEDVLVRYSYSTPTKYVRVKCCWKCAASGVLTTQDRGGKAVVVRAPAFIRGDRPF